MIVGLRELSFVKEAEEGLEFMLCIETNAARESGAGTGASYS